MWIGKVKRRKHDGGGGKRFQSPRVPRSKGSKVQGSQGPRYLKVTFKYELDSKEGPSCLDLKFMFSLKFSTECLNIFHFATFKLFSLFE